MGYVCGVTRNYPPLSFRTNESRKLGKGACWQILRVSAHLKVILQKMVRVFVFARRYIVSAAVTNTCPVDAVLGVPDSESASHNPDRRFKSGSRNHDGTVILIE